MGIFFGMKPKPELKKYIPINELQRKTGNEIEDTTEHDDPDENDYNTSNDDYSVDNKDDSNNDDDQNNTDDDSDDDNFEITDDDNPDDDQNNTDNDSVNDDNNPDDDNNFTLDDDNSNDDQDNTDDNTDDMNDDETGNEVDELQQLEDELFKNLNDGQKKIKIIELKTLFVKMYHDCDDIINKTNKIPKTEENLSVLERVINTLSDLKNNIQFYMSNTFKTLTYIENTMNYQKNLAILNAIKEIFDEIKKKKE